MYKHIKAMAVALLGLGAVAPAGAAEYLLDFTPYQDAYLTYGNTNVYSLPILANAYDLDNGGGTGPGNPYYVRSTPGAIQDLIVIYTGSSGTGVQTNTSGFDNAYLTPSGSQPDFATTDPLNMVAPDATGKTINTIYTDSWDASVGSLITFLDGGDPIFLFNNNETNTDQNLAIWAKLWITDPDGNLYEHYLYLSNVMEPYGEGGVPTGDATAYNPGDLAEPGVALPNTDYVLSGGEVCLAADLSIQACDGTEAYKINHNLGANQVAYAGVVPLLNDWLAALAGESDVDDYTLHLQLFVGCDPRIGQVTCESFQIDNGFEQLFIASTQTIFRVPEPSSLLLVALALLGFVGVSWRTARRTK